MKYKIINSCVLNYNNMNHFTSMRVVNFITTLKYTFSEYNMTLTLFKHSLPLDKRTKVNNLYRVGWQQILKITYVPLCFFPPCNALQYIFDRPPCINRKIFCLFEET